MTKKPVTSKEKAGNAFSSSTNRWSSIRRPTQLREAIGHDPDAIRRVVAARQHQPLDLDTGPLELHPGGVTPAARGDPEPESGPGKMSHRGRCAWNRVA